MRRRLYETEKGKRKRRKHNLKERGVDWKEAENERDAARKKHAEKDGVMRRKRFAKNDS